MASIVKISVLSASVVLLASGANSQCFGITVTGQFLSVNTTTGATTLVATLPSGSYLGLAYNGTDFYTTRNAVLTRVTPGSYTSTSIGSAIANRVEALAFGGDGLLYGTLDVDGGFNAETVAQLDITTGTSIPRANPGSQFLDMNGIAADSTGQLYLFNLDPRRIAQYSFASNTLTNVNSFAGSSGFVNGATRDDVPGSDGFLVATVANTTVGGPASLGRVSKTGVLSMVGLTNHSNITGLANIAPPVPEPASIAVLGLGVLALRRRKKSI